MPMPDVVDSLGQRASVYGAQGLDSINKLVQQGPGGVSVLSLIGGCATLAVGIDCLINIGEINTPFGFLLDIYLIIFGLTSILLEADINVLKKTPVVKSSVHFLAKYQAMVHEYALFLTKLQGRGMFYIFVGMLTIPQCLPGMCFKFWIGAWNIFVGALCVAMSFGIKPDLSSKRFTTLQRDPIAYKPVMQQQH